MMNYAERAKTVVGANTSSVLSGRIVCGAWKRLYNRSLTLPIIIAYVQQAKKKPLVTSILPDPSYARGWRCESYYLLFLDFGQGHRIRTHRRMNSEDWRWTTQTPLESYHSFINSALPCPTTPRHRPPTPHSCWLGNHSRTRLTTGHVPVLTRKEDQEGSISWSSQIADLTTASFAAPGVLTPLKALSPLSGEGVCCPSAVSVGRE